MESQQNSWTKMQRNHSCKFNILKVRVFRCNEKCFIYLYIYIFVKIKKYNTLKNNTNLLTINKSYVKIILSLN